MTVELHDLVRSRFGTTVYEVVGFTRHRNFGRWVPYAVLKRTDDPVVNMRHEMNVADLVKVGHQWPVK